MWGCADSLCTSNISTQHDDGGDELLQEMRKALELYIITLTGANP